MDSEPTPDLKLLPLLLQSNIYVWNCLSHLQIYPDTWTDTVTTPI